MSTPSPEPLTRSSAYPAFGRELPATAFDVAFWRWALEAADVGRQADTLPARAGHALAAHLFKDHEPPVRLDTAPLRTPEHGELAGALVGATPGPRHAVVLCAPLLVAAWQAAPPDATRWVVSSQPVLPRVCLAPEVRVLGPVSLYEAIFQVHGLPTTPPDVARADSCVTMYGVHLAQTAARLERWRAAWVTPSAGVPANQALGSASARDRMESAAVALDALRQAIGAPAHLGPWLDGVAAPDGARVDGEVRLGSWQDGAGGLTYRIEWRPNAEHGQRAVLALAREAGSSEPSRCGARARA